MRHRARNLAERCVHMTAKHTRCALRKARGSDLCELHIEIEKKARRVKTEKEDAVTERLKKAASDPSLTPQQRAQRRHRAELREVGIDQRKGLTEIVLNEQARLALERLKAPLPPGSRLDPKVVLLNSVRSAHEQQQVWEALLSATPDADFAHLGEVPLPGSPLGTKGARIEFIQKALSDATQRAARISKMAIDAGIEERLVRLAEEQSALIADTVRIALVATIQQLNLSPAQTQSAIDLALGRAATHLRQLAAGLPSATVEGEAVRVGDERAS